MVEMAKGQVPFLLQSLYEAPIVGVTLVLWTRGGFARALPYGTMNFFLPRRDGLCVCRHWGRAASPHTLRPRVPPASPLLP